MKNVIVLLFPAFLSLSLSLIMCLPRSISVCFFWSSLSLFATAVFSVSSLPICPPCHLLLHKRLSNCRAGMSLSQRKGGKVREERWRWDGEIKKKREGVHIKGEVRTAGQKVFRWCNVPSGSRSARLWFISVCFWADPFIADPSDWLCVYIPHCDIKRVRSELQPEAECFKFQCSPSEPAAGYLEGGFSVANYRVLLEHFVPFY